MCLAAAGAATRWGPNSPDSLLFSLAVGACRALCSTAADGARGDRHSPFFSCSSQPFLHSQRLYVAQGFSGAIPRFYCGADWGHSAWEGYTHSVFVGRLLGVQTLLTFPRSHSSSRGSTLSTACCRWGRTHRSATVFLKSRRPAAFSPFFPAQLLHLAGSAILFQALQGTSPLFSRVNLRLFLVADGVGARCGPPSSSPM